MTDPIFQATGTVNVFASFSGKDSIAQLAEAEGLEALRQLTASGSQADGTWYAIPASKASGILDGPDHLGIVAGEAGAEALSVVIPEPTILMLMLFATPFILVKPLRGRLAIR